MENISLETEQLTTETENITSEITDTQLIVKKERFISYTLKTTYPKNKVFTVERRYSDFEWLRKMFITEYPDRIIPIIPEKDMLGKFSPEVIAYRKRTLNNFLKEVLLDEKWVTDTNVERFLKDSEQGFETSLEKGGSFFNSIFSAVTNLANETVTIPEDSTEAWFNEKAVYISALGDNFKNVKLVRDRVIEIENEKLETNKILSEYFVNEEFLKISNNNTEKNMFQEFMKNNAEVNELIKKFHKFNFQFEDTLNNQHLIALEEIRLLVKRRNDEIDVLLKANELMQQFNDEALTDKLKESENNLKQLNFQVKRQIETLLADKSNIVKRSLIQFVKDNIQIGEQNILLWKDLQTKLSPSKNQIEVK